MGAKTAEIWAYGAGACKVGRMLLVALAVGIGLFVIDVRDFANRKRSF